MTILEKFPTKYILLAIPFCLYVLSQNIADPDLFARLAVGKLWLNTGKPIHDPFSFLETHAVWVDHEWLSGILFYKLFSFGSDLALKIYKLSTLLFILFFLLKAQKLNFSKISIPWSIICFSPTLYLWQSNVRSQLFTYMLYSILLYLCVKIDREKIFNIIPNIWILIFFTISLNMHGGFVLPLFLFLGFILKNLIFSCELPPKHKKSLIGFALLLLALTLMNPYFASYWSFLLKALTMKRPTISEWAPLGLTSFFSIYIISLLSIILLLSKQRGLDKLFILILLAYAGFSSGRLIAFFFMFAFVHYADAWEKAISIISQAIKKRTVEIKNAGFCAYLCILAYYLTVTSSEIFTNFNSLDYSSFPVDILERANKCLKPGRILTDFDSGSYALWVLYPKFTTGMDGRYEEVFSQDTFNLVAEAYGGGGQMKQEEALRKIKPDYILVRETDVTANPLIKEMGFEEIISDNNYSIIGKGGNNLSCPL